MRARIWALAAVAGAALAVVTSRGQAQTPPPSPAPTAMPPTAAPAKPLAVVNGDIISLAEVDAVLNQDGPRPVQLTETQLREMRMRTVALMIDEMLIEQFLKQAGPRVDPAEVAKKMAEVEADWKQKGKNLQEFLKQSGQSEAQFRMDITRYLQWATYLKARITDEDIKRYYDENKDFFDGVLVRASHVLLLVPAGATDGQRQQAREKLLALRQEIVSGKLDFAEAAKKHSQCPSGPNGGDIGPFPRKGRVDEVIAKAAFAMQPGQVSDIVQTDYGLHLIKVTERRPGQPSDFTKIKESVRGMCEMEVRGNLLVQLHKAAKVEVNLP
jgi:parvulin-like peptidyl-prolyl isomerase